MSIQDILHETWRSLTNNKGRSALTILGIVIGIAAVISMTSLVGGIQLSLSSTFGLNQSKLIYTNLLGKYTLSKSDVEELKAAIPEYKTYLAVETYHDSPAESREQGFTNNISGVEQGYFGILDMQIVAGRDFTSYEYKSGQDVAILEAKSVQQAFALDKYGNATSLLSKKKTTQQTDEEREDAEQRFQQRLSEDEKRKLYAAVIGKTIDIKGREYTIVGVAANPQSNMNEGPLSHMLNTTIPLKSLEINVTGIKSYTRFVGAVSSPSQAADVTKKTEKWLGRHFGIEKQRKEQGPDGGGGPAFSVMSMEAFAQSFNVFMAGFQMIVGSIAGISLLVGGIGIMNMMLTNVTERIREIGLRKALGAKRRDITRQFLLESIALCITGGIIGMALGLLSAMGLSNAVSMYMKMHVDPAFSWNTVALAVSISVCIGMLFGYYPARRAARLDPIESLRYQ